MSQENVEIVRRTYAAFSEGNLGPVLEALDPDLEWNASDVFFDQPRTYHGRQMWQEQFLPELAEIFQAYRAVPEQVIDVRDQVLAVGLSE
jgi:ketosteroid isomerase-like protein